MFKPHILAIALAAALTSVGAGAESLRYSGSLVDAGAPAEGNYALRMTLFDAASGGRPVGHPITLPAVAVAAGAFTTEVDFGLPQAALDRLWMQIEVAAPGGAFEVLGTRESLSSESLAGSVCWSTDGNAGTSAANDFLGTTDAVRLTLRVANQPVMRLEPTAASPNFIVGLPTNSVQTGVLGAAITGGGAPNGFPNFVGSHYGAIGGGAGNKVGEFTFPVTDFQYGTIAGGSQNQVKASHGAIGGGLGNDVAGAYGVVPGGAFNLAGGVSSFAGGNSARVRAAVAYEGTPPSDNVGAGDMATFIWNAGVTQFTSSGERQFLVQAPGGFGINTNTPLTALNVRHIGSSILGATPDPSTVILAERTGGNAFISILGSVGTQRGILFGEPDSSADGAITYDNAGSNAMQFRTNGNVTRMTLASNGDLTVTGNAFKPGGGSWATSSDARLKHAIEPLGGALARLLRLRGVSYEYAHPDALRPQGTHIGFVAQEVQKVFPDWVETDADGYLTVGPRGFEALTVESLRQLAEENAVLHAANQSLEQRLAEVEARLAKAGN